jgi:hypothetical protein
MAIRAHSTLAPSSRRRLPAAAPVVRRRRRAEDYGMIRPSPAQRALAYIANGDLPPIPFDGLLSGFTSSVLCLAVGAWIGGNL